ncbi:MAG: spore photoproduct lyase family protein, partial [Bacteriovoracaceae bacterium]
MFDTIFVERNIKNSPRAQKIIQRFGGANLSVIDRYDEVWGKVKKPYLHKRTNLNLFLAQKKGQLVKEAPNAYGIEGEKHFYFIHAYNCIYECEYCYLQGYFNSPDVVLFINHEEIAREMQKVLDAHPAQTVWFHAGEFSDSLALSHITGELEAYWDFFKSNPRAKLELRTKSVNIKRLNKLEPLPNVYASFSLSPKKAAKERELKTPGLSSRLKAIKELKDSGHQIGIHFDPVVYHENVFKEYEELFLRLKEIQDLKTFSYFSLGVVRFTPDVFRETKKNYPNSPM